MNKNLSFKLQSKKVLILLFALIATTSWASDIQKSWYKLSDDGTALKLWKMERSNINLQDEKDFATVSVIGKMAFCNLRTLESITLPASITTIEQSAFEYCAGLKSFTSPAKLAIIGKSAFSKCTGLKNVKLSASVVKIDELAFAGCTSLASITCENPIPPSVTATTFDYVDKDNCIVYVPKGSKSKYSVDDGWKEFKNIVEQ